MYFYMLVHASYVLCLDVYEQFMTKFDLSKFLDPPPLI